MTTSNTQAHCSEVTLLYPTSDIWQIEHNITKTHLMEHVPYHQQLSHTHKSLLKTRSLLSCYIHRTKPALAFTSLQTIPNKRQSRTKLIPKLHSPTCSCSARCRPARKDSAGAGRRPRSRPLGRTAPAAGESEPQRLSDARIPPHTRLREKEQMW